MGRIEHYANPMNLSAFYRRFRGPEQEASAEGQAEAESAEGEGGGSAPVEPARLAEMLDARSRSANDSLRRMIGEAEQELTRQNDLLSDVQRMVDSGNARKLYG